MSDRLFEKFCNEHTLDNIRHDVVYCVFPCLCRILALTERIKESIAELFRNVSRRASDNVLYHLVYDGDHLLTNLLNVSLPFLDFAAVAVFLAALRIDLLLDSQLLLRKVFELGTAAFVLLRSQSLIGCVV